MSEDLRFPIGKFDPDFEATLERRQEFIDTISNFPNDLYETIKNFWDDQLDTPYRPDGWTVRQLVHHIADSHINSYCRFKLALTEDTPTIRPYHEDLWAKLDDSKMPIGVSVKIIESIHSRWSVVLSSMTDDDFQRKLVHPDSGEWTLEKMLGLYDWHSRHHLAHITSLAERENW